MGNVFHSSSLTFLYKYLLPIAIIGASVVMICVLPINDDKSSMFILPVGVFVLLSFWTGYLSLKLKKVTVSDDGVLIYTRRGNQVVKFTDVEWVSQMYLMNPPIIRLKYIEVQTGLPKHILIVPSLSNELLKINLRDVEMTKFIRKSTHEAREDSIQRREPSSWLPVLLVFGSIMLVQLLVIFL